MKPDIGAACRAALGQWRRDRDVIVAIAGVFFFLPNLLLGLFMAPGEAAGAAGGVADDAALIESLAAYFTANVHWLALQAVAELFGVGVLLALLLDERRPTVGAAMATTARRLPTLVAVTLVTNIAKVVGLMLFVLPGLFVIGRTFVVLPAIMARASGIGETVSKALSLTEGRAVQLVALSGAVYFAAQTAVLLLSATARVVSSGGTNPVTTAMLAAAVSIVGAMMSIAFVLVRAAVYRVLVNKG